jgi:septal ring factor EnvC (AmiA/AmiB activator)
MSRIMLAIVVGMLMAPPAASQDASDPAAWEQIRERYDAQMIALGKFADGVRERLEQAAAATMQAEEARRKAEAEAQRLRSELKTAQAEIAALRGQLGQQKTEVNTVMEAVRKHLRQVEEKTKAITDAIGEP